MGKSRRVGGLGAVLGYQASKLDPFDVEGEVEGDAMRPAMSAARAQVRTPVRHRPTAARSAASNRMHLAAERGNPETGEPDLPPRAPHNLTITPTHVSPGSPHPTARNKTGTVEARKMSEDIAY